MFLIICLAIWVELLIGGGEPSDSEKAMRRDEGLQSLPCEAELDEYNEAVLGKAIPDSRHERILRNLPRSYLDQFLSEQGSPRVFPPDTTLEDLYEYYWHEEMWNNYYQHRQRIMQKI